MDLYALEMTHYERIEGENKKSHIFFGKNIFLINYLFTKYLTIFVFY